MNHFTELKIEDLIQGSGTAVKKGGALVTAHYRGYLTDGREFDSSYERGEPFQVVLSRKKVIAAWVEGLQGMQVGGKDFNVQRFILLRGQLMQHQRQ